MWENNENKILNDEPVKSSAWTDSGTAYSKKTTNTEKKDKNYYFRTKN